MQIKDLIELGLTKNQASIYLELIKHPEQTAGKIAKMLSIDRSFVYGILSSLTDKGLVTHTIKAGKRLFHPTDPENFLKELEEKKAKVSKIVNELKLIKQTKKQERTVDVYEGKSGIKAFVREFLDSDNFYTLGGGGKLNIFETLKYEYPHYLKELKKKKITGKLITSVKNKEIMKNIYQNTKVDIKTFKELKSKTSFTIFKDKLAIYSFEEKPFVITIDDKSISDALKDYFNLLWKQAK